MSGSRPARITSRVAGPMAETRIARSTTAISIQRAIVGLLPCRRQFMTLHLHPWHRMNYPIHSASRTSAGSARLKALVEGLKCGLRGTPVRRRDIPRQHVRGVSVDPDVAPDHVLG